MKPFTDIQIMTHLSDITRNNTDYKINHLKCEPFQAGLSVGEVSSLSRVKQQFIYFLFYLKGMHSFLNHAKNGTPLGRFEKNCPSGSRPNKSGILTEIESITTLKFCDPEAQEPGFDQHSNSVQKHCYESIPISSKSSQRSGTSTCSQTGLQLMFVLKSKCCLSATFRF